MKINKIILVPLLTAIALFIKEAFDYKLPDGAIDFVAELIMIAISGAGAFIHPRKAKFDDAENFE